MSEERFREESAQTRLHVYPHMGYGVAMVVCSRATQTAITQDPGNDNEIFFALLEFIPYKEIAQHSIRTIDIPRKTRLQFKLPSDGAASDVSVNASLKASQVKLCTAMQTELSFNPQFTNAQIAPLLVVKAEKGTQTDGDHRAEIMGLDKMTSEIHTY